MWREKLNSKWPACLVFILGFGYFCVDMQMHDLLFEHPSGIHQWRQTDGTSITKIFYQDGNSLFKPKIHNQLGKDGSAGGEFPIFYFLTSKLYHLFGPHEFILRLVHFSCFLLGLFAFLFYSFGLFKLRITAVIPLLLAVASPTIMFYALNFLPEAPGFGLSLAATAFLLIYLDKRKRLFFWLAFVFYLWAGLTKVSMLLPMFAVACTVVSRHVLKLERRNIGQVWGIIAMVAGILLPVAAWYVYIAHYNEVNDGVYFTTKVTPIWQLPFLRLAKITVALFNEWPNIVFPTWQARAALLCMLLFFPLWRRIDPVLKWTTIFASLGSVLYVLMFYIAFSQHDYYFIVLFFPLLFLFTSVLQGLASLFRNRYYQVGLLLVFAAITWKAAGDAVYVNKQTYQGWFRDFALSESLYGLEAFLDKHGVTYEDKVFVAPDMSPNRALYLMNRKGWSELNGIYNTTDMDSLIDRGAQYAVVLDTSFYSITFLYYHVKDTVGYHREILVFELEKSR